MNYEELEGIIGYCSYCHEEIYDCQTYIAKNGDKYHPECHEIINHYHYYDEFKEE